MIGSPLKKARPSISGPAPPALENNVGPNSGFPSALGDILAKAEAAQAAKGSAGEMKENVQASEVMDEEEEL
jgi:hypothetical protein